MLKTIEGDVVGFYFFAWAPKSLKYEDSNERKKIGDPSYPPKKAEFGRTKAKMVRFSQKGLYYSFGILHGLLTHKNNRIPMREKKFGNPPTPLKKPVLGGQKPKWAVSPRRVYVTVLRLYRGS